MNILKRHKINKIIIIIKIAKKLCVSIANWIVKNKKKTMAFGVLLILLSNIYIVPLII